MLSAVNQEGRLHGSKVGGDKSSFLHAVPSWGFVFFLRSQAIGDIMHALEAK